MIVFEIIGGMILLFIIGCGVMWIRDNIRLKRKLRAFDNATEHTKEGHANVPNVYGRSDKQNESR